MVNALLILLEFSGYQIYQLYVFLPLILPELILNVFILTTLKTKNDIKISIFILGKKTTTRSNFEKNLLVSMLKNSLIKRVLKEFIVTILICVQEDKYMTF
jgi:hypothetical protein